MESKDKLNDAKVKESDAKREELVFCQIYQDKQNTLATIFILKEQKALGLILDDEFKDQCKIAFGL